MDIVATLAYIIYAIRSVKLIGNTTVKIFGNTRQIYSDDLLNWIRYYLEIYLNRSNELNYYKNLAPEQLISIGD